MQKLMFILIFNSNFFPGPKENNSLLPRHSFSNYSHVISFSPESILNKSSATMRSADMSSADNEKTATGFFNTTGYRDGFTKLRKANTPGVGTEFATVFGIDRQTGMETVLPVITTLPGHSVTMILNPPGMQVTAIAHTHPDDVFPSPSAGDIYAFGNYAQLHPGLLYYILAAGGSNYVLMVTDTAKLTLFLKLYPQKDNIAADAKGNAGRGANYKQGSVLYNSMQKLAENILSHAVRPDDPMPAELDAAHEAVQVYILDHYNTGMALYKQSANGNFVELRNRMENAGIINR